MSEWNLRPVVETDYPRLVAISNQLALQQRSLAEFVQMEAKRDRSRPSIRLAATDAAGQVVGHGILFRSPWRPEGHYWLSGSVDIAHQGRGAGSALLTAFEQWAREWGQHALETEVRDDRPEGKSFLEARGFQQTEHYFRSELDLTNFDPAPFMGVLERARANGYRFLSMADLDLEAGKRAVYALDTDCTRDEPGIAPDWEPPSYETYEREIFTGPQFDPGAVFLAVKEGEYAGMTGLHFPPGGTPWTFFTGVRREHRGQGLAQALKLLAVEYARSRGHARVGTGNHERNQPMLAVNRKFGFQPLPGVYLYRKDLIS